MKWQTNKEWWGIHSVAYKGFYKATVKKVSGDVCTWSVGHSGEQQYHGKCETTKEAMEQAEEILNKVENELRVA